MNTYLIPVTINFEKEYQTAAGASHHGRDEVAKEVRTAFPGRNIVVGNAKRVDTKTGDTMTAKTQAKAEIKEKNEKTKKDIAAKKEKTVVADEKKAAKPAAKTQPKKATKAAKPKAEVKTKAKSVSKTPKASSSKKKLAA